MAFNDQTSDKGKRTVLYERVDRPAAGGGAQRVYVDVLMPYSLLEVDGVTYIETNSTSAIAEGGGSHALPSYGQLVDEQRVSRSLGIRSADIPQGTTRGNPAESMIHRQGWI